MEADEAPEALDDYLLCAHVSDRIYQANAVESELNEVTIVVLIQVVTG